MYAKTIQSFTLDGLHANFCISEESFSVSNALLLITRFRVDEFLTLIF